MYVFSLPISRAQFVEKLSAQVEEGDASLFSGDIANVFDKREYFGQVTENGFKIRRKRIGLLGRQQRNRAIATGTFSEVNRQLTIEAEINGYNPTIIVAIIVAIALLTFCIVKNFFAFVPFLMVVFILVKMFVSMKEDVRLLKKDLEREFFYVTKDDSCIQSN